MVKFCRNYNLLNLMIYYALLLTVVIGSFVTLISWMTLKTLERDVTTSLINGMDKVTDQVVANDREVRDTGQRLTSTSGQMDNLYQYFQLSAGQYLAYSRAHRQDDLFYYLPTESAQVFAGNTAIKKMVITMSDSKHAFVSTRQQTKGQRTLTPPDLGSQFSFHYTFVNNTEPTSYGNLYLVYATQPLTRALAHVANARGLQVLVLAADGTPLYRYRGPAVSKRQLNTATTAAQQTLVDSQRSLHQLRATYRLRHVRLPNGHQIIALTGRDYLRQRKQRLILRFAAIALAIDLVLIGGLWGTFRRYRARFTAMIAAMRQVGHGNLDVRMPVPHQTGDLQVLANGLNQMLDEINHYIYQIYHLQLAQKDANMRALQSQIQPHFLYNTLEYIRMYAVAANQTELADVVYAFAALLRNNTDQSPTTTLEREVAFIEKYIYLYQMRFPDQIAYGLRIAPELKQLVIPKFILQPLVENYFAHGIDYARTDNAVDVTAWLDGADVHLRVTDNGRGISPVRLHAVRAQLAQPQTVESESTQRSIGLHNVFERLQGTFGDRAQLTIQTNAQGGVTVELIFEKRVD
ncbi:sensor histidine kinase [Lactiplantibacillus modestisalitolerans]|uniref:Sensor histidine kinase n=1 Tax=Lactiplantibacillus modestisalitolerans TaxID=1457219 RepID=A0ABV5WSD2_9LACO|nr:sensor histidine kinase [Lactiplantibacillus modestisalitolerans]